MSDKRKYTIEELDATPLYMLRLILRGLSGTPSNKSAREIKEEIYTPFSPKSRANCR